MEKDKHEYEGYFMLLWIVLGVVVGGLLHPFLGDAPMWLIALIAVAVMVVSILPLQWFMRKFFNWPV